MIVNVYKLHGLLVHSLVLRQHVHYSVISFSKVHDMFLGYFDPVKSFFKTKKSNFQGESTGVLA